MGSCGIELVEKAGMLEQTSKNEDSSSWRLRGLIGMAGYKP